MKHIRIGIEEYEAEVVVRVAVALAPYLRDIQTLAEQLSKGIYVPEPQEATK